MNEAATRFTISIVERGERMVGKGEMSKEGGAWKPDLQLTYSRTVST
jgi:hypothetical protein